MPGYGGAVGARLVVTCAGGGGVMISGRLYVVEGVVVVEPECE